MTNDRQDLEMVTRYVDAAMRWNGWGSPVGLGVLIASVGFFLVCLHWAGILR